MDISVLGLHYGLTGALVAAYSYLDVGPTMDRTPNGRPKTDNVIGFEDLVMFALNYQVVTQPQIRTIAGAVGADDLQLDWQRASGDHEVAAKLTLRGSGRVQATSFTSVTE